jgi:outer membrane murein-binding lipoprotein Lpp
MGLIECLMSEESSEIQRLNAQIRLLTIKNEYLRKDNELLSNQIAFLNEKVNQLGNHKQ